MSIQILLALAPCLLVLPLAASGEDQSVEIGHYELNPPEISIRIGESVIFVNRVDMPGGHSVVADDNSFKSPQLDKNQSWIRLFEKVGAFTYYVKEHPDTRGVVNVMEVGNPKGALNPKGIVNE